MARQDMCRAEHAADGNSVTSSLEVTSRADNSNWMETELVARHWLVGSDLLELKIRQDTRD